MKNKKSIAIIIAGVLGIAYGIYLISYFGGSFFNTTDGFEMLGAGIAGALVMPHTICVALGGIFCLTSGMMNKFGIGLAGAIMFAVSAVLFPLYALFVVPMIILGFVGASKVKKINAEISSNNNYENNNSNISNEDELLKYKELLDAGVITPEEFESKKKELLNI